MDPNPFDPFAISNREIHRRMCRHLIPLWRCTSAVCQEEIRTLFEAEWHKTQSKLINTSPLPSQSLKTWSRP